MSRPASVLYWSVASLLVAFGVLTGFSIGIPFLLLGLALMVLARHRHRPEVFWSGIAAIVLFIVGFILGAPFGCTATATLPGQGAQGHTACSNVLGINYSGSGEYNPSLWPALVAGIAAGAAGGTVTRLILRPKRGGLAPS